VLLLHLADKVFNIVGAVCVLLELGNRIGQAFAQAGEFSGAGEDAELGGTIAENSLDNHCPSESGNSRSGGVFAENKIDQTVEREDVEAVVAGYSRVIQDGALGLICCLLRN
jgi:hypothetical protein